MSYIYGAPNRDVSRSHTTMQHSRQDSSGRVISSSQRPLPDNTRHSQQTNIHAPVGFEPTVSVGERPQNYPLDRAATGTGNKINQMHLFLKFVLGMKLYMFRTVPLSIISSFSLYIQQWYMSYRFADGLRTGSGWNILILLASCQQTCMTYTIAVCTVKNS